MTMKKFKVMIEVIKIGYIIVEANSEEEALEEARYDYDFTEVNYDVNYGGDIKWVMDGPAVRELETDDNLLKDELLF